MLNYPVNRQSQMLFGHSLGGLFALWNYSQKPLFRAFAAISPSIWWNNHALLQQTPKEQHPVFLAVGENEGEMVDDAVNYAKSFELTPHIIANENHASVVPTVMSQVLRFFKENSVTSSNLEPSVENMK